MYRGRFAPSPTGPLHLGSLVAAVASWADARHHGGEWLVRMEDVDGPRTQPGAAESILKTLERCGLCWDGVVWVQSERLPAYEEALLRLRRAGQVYGCGCTRREIQDSTVGPAGGERPYPGTCRAGLAPGRAARSERLRVPAGVVEFEDRLLGPQREDVARVVGDFVLKRADGIYSYQLAVVVDDAAQGVTDVVRGEDLLTSTARQIVLQRALGLAGVRYLHFPVARDAAGEKLSKQNGAAPVSGELPELRAAAAFLGHEPPPGYAAPDILKWLAERGPFSR